MADRTDSPTGTHLSKDVVAQIETGHHGDPFSVLGPHRLGRETWVFAFDPGATQMAALVGSKAHKLDRVAGSQAFFAGKVPGGKPYLLQGTGLDEASWEYDDPYKFGPILGEVDQYLLGEGTHQKLWRALGAHVMTHEGARGTHFAVWAPNARRVSVVGEFTYWDGRRHGMRRPTGSRPCRYRLPPGSRRCAVS